jgi:hypothetical protein
MIDLFIYLKEPVDYMTQSQCAVKKRSRSHITEGMLFAFLLILTGRFNLLRLF